MSMGLSGTPPTLTSIIFAQQIRGTSMRNATAVNAASTVYGAAGTLYTVPALRVALIGAWAFSCFDNGGATQGSFTIGPAISWAGKASNIAGQPDVAVVLTAGQTVTFTAVANAGASMMISGIEEDV